MSSMVRMTMFSSFGGKEHSSQIKMMTFLTVKTNGLLSVTFNRNLHKFMQFYFCRAVIQCT